jgi:hypothetical protein
MKIVKCENRVNWSTSGMLFDKFHTKTLNTVRLKVNLDVHMEVWTSFILS